MDTSTIVADKVRVFFDDDTSTIIYVMADEDIRDAIVELCEREGYDMGEISGYHIIESLTEEQV